MGSVFQFYRGWWMFRLKNPKLDPQCLLSCNCHTAPSVLEVNDQKIISRNQVTKRSKKGKLLCQQVLDSFDQQYSQELGPLWPRAREVLLDPHSWQYAVMLNRFSTVTDITQTLQSQGFSTFLPQTDAPALVYNGFSTVSNFKNQAGNDSLLQTYCISKCPPNDSRDQPDSTTHMLAPEVPLPSGFSPSTTLQCYIHSYPLRFPSQLHIPGQLKQYYLLNAASLLPVLALKVRDGEKILDLCSAPGGKALVIMQCATPELLCCNEPDPHRQKWLAKTLESFLPHTMTSRVIVSAQDGRYFGHSEVGKYDKVLVDAPCSNDRSWLYSQNNQQGEQRLKERAMLPVLQVQLLKSALSAVRPGGVVVYSTCTLSSSENYSVVETVLKDCPEAEPEDLWEELAVSTSKYFTFFNPGGHTRHNPSLLQQNDIMSYNTTNKLGILVVPQPGNTWGPMFLSRIKKKAPQP